MFVGIIKAFIL